MKFLLVADAFLGAAGTGVTKLKPRLFGGAEVYLYDLARLLRDGGHVVTVVQKGEKSGHLTLDGIRIRTIQTPSLALLRSVGVEERFHHFGFWWRRALTETYDRVHFHYFYTGYPFGDTTMTGTCHGIEWDLPGKSFRERVSAHLTKVVAKRALARLGKVAANDTFFLRWVQSEAPDYRDKITVIPNYVDTERFHPNVPPDKKLFAQYKTMKRILLPKNPAYARGTDIAIKALAILPRNDVVLWIAGDSTARPIFEKLAHDLGVGDRVIFLGHKDHLQEMPSIYAAADIVIIPSPGREGTALAALEGMATGKPVIVSNVAGLPDVIEDRRTGLQVAPLPQPLTAALDELLGDKKLANRLASAGLKSALATFSYHRWALQYLKFFGVNR